MCKYEEIEGWRLSNGKSIREINNAVHDEGEGMLDAFLSAMKGERVRIHAHDALMRWIEAEYGIVADTAIIEIAQTAGLALIEPEQRNPMKATSWGVGEMIMNAYRRGVRRFIVGLGGSATSDCGIGISYPKDTLSSYCFRWQRQVF
jgi:glycerate 2-kinase